MKQIFPKEIIENSIGVHQFKHSNKSKIIYTVNLSSLILLIQIEEIRMSRKYKFHNKQAAYFISFTM